MVRVGLRYLGLSYIFILAGRLWFKPPGASASGQKPAASSPPASAGVIQRSIVWHGRDRRTGATHARRRPGDEIDPLHRKPNESREKAAEELP